MKNTRNVLILAWALIGISCVNQIEEEIQVSNVPISFVSHMETTTRATDSAFEKGDKVGLFAMLNGTLVTGSRYIDNLCLECSDNATMYPEETVFYPEGDNTLDFVSYYPYQENGIPKKGSQMQITVQTDQSSDKNRSLSDFLVAKKEGVAKSNNSVELTYQHQLAKIKVKLVPQGTENVDDMLAADPFITLVGFNTQAVYNFVDGTISDLSVPASILSYGKWSKSDEDALEGKEFIVIPQTIDSSKQYFTLEWNGKIYTCLIEEDELVANTEYTITIRVEEKQNQTLTGVISSITAWQNKEAAESDGNYEIDAIHTASLSFATSDIYRVWRNGAVVAEVCKEYLSADNIHSRAIVVYPVDADGTTDLQDGTVLRLLDGTGNVHGGTVQWDTDSNKLTYTPGSSAIIETFYVGADGQIVFEKPEETSAINISSYVLRDLRGGEMVEYPIVKIATQYWMKEDLRATAYKDGTELTERITLGQGAGYLTSEDGAIFYNKEAIEGGDLLPHQDWKLPNNEEWKKLIAYVNNKPALITADLWKGLSNSSAAFTATNETGLSVLSSGLYGNSGKHMNSGIAAAYFIGADSNDGLADNAILIMGSKDEISTAGSNVSSSTRLSLGLSIRCIKK